MVQIGISGKPTSLAWYEVWEAVMAVFTMCVRNHGKGGKAFGLGQYLGQNELRYALISWTGLRKNIYLELMDEYPDASLPTIHTTRANNTSSYGWFKAFAASNASDIDSLSSFSTMPFEASAIIDGDRNSLVELPDIDASNSSRIDQS